MNEYIYTDTSDLLLHTEMVQLRASSNPEAVKFTLLVDGVASESKESLSLQLVPPPSTLQSMPAGEAVFFKSRLSLTIIDADGEWTGAWTEPVLPEISNMELINMELIGSIVGVVGSFILTTIVVLVIVLICVCYRRSLHIHRSTKNLEL